MKYYGPFIFCLVFIIIIFSLFSLNVAGGSEGAEMKDAVLTATPINQGLGGEVKIEAELSFFGGCCYPLFAYDISVNINLPDNVELIKGNPIQKLEVVEAVEGGAPTKIHFIWFIKSKIPGNYLISVNVTTSNCGNTNSEIVVSYVEGCSMSIPIVYPDIPTTNKDTYILIEVNSGLESVEVESVNFFYCIYQNDLDKDVKNIYALNDSLIVGKTPIKGNIISSKQIDYQPNSWTGVIPRQEKECLIYYWIVATDNNGKNTTSMVYSFNVLEIEHIYTFLDVMTWFPFIVSIIGIIIIAFYFNRSSNTTSDKNLLLLGSNSKKKIYKVDNIQIKRVDTSSFRTTILIILLIVSIIMLIWAIYSGYFLDFTELNGGI